MSQTQTRSEKTSRATKYMDDRTKAALDTSGSQSIDDFLKQKQEEFLRKGRAGSRLPISTAADWRRGE